MSLFTLPGLGPRLNHQFSAHVKFILILTYASFSDVWMDSHDRCRRQKIKRNTQKKTNRIRSLFNDLERIWIVAGRAHKINKSISGAVGQLYTSKQMCQRWHNSLRCEQVSCIISMASFIWSERQCCDRGSLSSLFIGFCSSRQKGDSPKNTSAI